MQFRNPLLYPTELRVHVAYCKHFTNNLCLWRVFVLPVFYTLSIMRITSSIRKAIWKDSRNGETRPRGWMLDIRLPGGKRVRKFYDTKAKAEEGREEEIGKLQKEGLETFNMPQALRLDAIESRKILDKAGLQEMRLSDAIQVYVSHYKLHKRTIPCSEAVTKLLSQKGKEGLSERHLNGMKTRLGKFVSEYGDIPLADVNTESLREWLEKACKNEGSINSITHKNYLQCVGQLFRWAKVRHYVDEDPTEGIETFKRKPTNPHLLSLGSHQ